MGVAITHRLCEAAPEDFKRLYNVGVELIKSDGRYDSIKEKMDKIYGLSLTYEENVCSLFSLFAKECKLKWCTLCTFMLKNLMAVNSFTGLL